MLLIQPRTPPLITIITPNYNYGDYIEGTLSSILDQGYSALELIVIDGGSSDQSIDVIKKFEGHIDYWQSKPDKGQADAINQGLALAKGRIVNWINSDDQLAPGALSHIAECYQDEPDMLFAGSVLNYEIGSPHKNELVKQKSLTVPSIINGNAVFHQPGLWWNPTNLRLLGGLDCRLHYCFDYLLLLRYLARWPKVCYSDRVVARFAIHPSSKTFTSQTDFDEERVYSLELLNEDKALKPFLNLINKRLQLQIWQSLVTNLLTDESNYGLRQAIKIFGLSLLNPSTRFSRYTAGAIRKSLIKTNP